VDEAALLELGELELIPVQRNRGMDAILRRQYRGRPVALRVQRPHETALEAATLLARAGASKSCELMILIVTAEQESSPADSAAWPARVVSLDSTRRQIAKLLEQSAMSVARARGRRGSNQPALNESSLNEHRPAEPK
jgi:hypothetical protein